MAYNSAIDNVYNHYLTTYAPKSSVSKYDTHKKSELRGIYNSMLKVNKDAPLYILDSSNDSREFVVGLKEDARHLRNTIASLGGANNDKMFNKKAAYSSNEDMVTAEYIADTEEEGDAAPFTIEVTQLASNQENLGYALRSDEPVGLTPNAYSFDISINDLGYEFQFNIREGDTNKDIQERLARLISNSGIGLTADVLEGGNGTTALRLSSDDIGLRKDSESIFTVSDDRTSKASGAVEYLGIDYVSKKPSNAEFKLNGETRTASSNHFTIDKKYELTLKGVHSFEGDVTEIGTKTDLDSVTDNVARLVDGYNSFVDTAQTYRAKHPAGHKLLGEMERLMSYYQSGLSNIGIDVDESGKLNMDERAFKASLVHDDGFSQLSSITGFANSVLRKANQISINPMEYVDKTVVAYKNPGHNFSTPYISSNYSGMLFNSYC